MLDRDHLRPCGTHSCLVKQSIDHNAVIGTGEFPAQMASNAENVSV